MEVITASSFSTLRAMASCSWQLPRPLPSMSSTTLTGNVQSGGLRCSNREAAELAAPLSAAAVKALERASKHRSTLADSDETRLSRSLSASLCCPNCSCACRMVQAFKTPLCDSLCHQYWMDLRASSLINDLPLRSAKCRSNLCRCCKDFGVMVIVYKGSIFSLKIYPETEEGNGRV